MSERVITRELVNTIRASAHRMVDELFDVVEYDAQDRAVNDFNLDIKRDTEKLGLNGLNSAFVATRTTMTLWFAETAASMRRQLAEAEERCRDQPQ